MFVCCRPHLDGKYRGWVDATGREQKRIAGKLAQLDTQTNITAFVIDVDIGRWIYRTTRDP